MDEKKKKIIISIVLIVVFIFIVTGISYAAFRYVGQGEEVNQITTGTIRMNYEEGSNVIRLNNALPTRDATGKVRLNEGEYFDFSVTTNITGDAIINWEIAAEDFIDNTFDGANVKFYLTKIVDGKEVEISTDLPAVYSEQTSENNKTGRPINMMSLLTGTSSTQGEETINYRLRLYVTEEYNPQGDGGGLIFKTRINVYGKVSTEKELPIMRAYEYNIEVPSATPVFSNSSDDYHSNEYREYVTSIVTKKNTLLPETAIKSWDVSEALDNSVIAYLEGNKNDGYKVTIGGNGGIEANPNSDFLFCAFTNLKNIDLSSLYTTNITSMFCMFADCRLLETLNLFNFDTSKVTNMNTLFYRCLSLTNIFVSSKWVVSEGVDIEYMFGGCSIDHVTVI